MFIRVLFFSVFQDITGCSEMKIELHEGDTVETLCTRLSSLFPKLLAWRASTLVAVNETYVKPSHVLSADDELALMPPVQGG